jgi:uncharacterized Fe-S cluster protein YjdI/CDGSH-type Zn-finger protein
MEKNDREYKNEEITVYWKPKKCIHATICFRELSDVFRPSKRPWVNMDGAPTKDIIKIVEKCPTDALTWEWNDKNKPKKQPEQENNEKNAEVRIMKDGPMVISGDFSLIDEDGNELKKMKMSSICRCGSTNNPPYCDGTHRKSGFEGD